MEQQSFLASDAQLPAKESRWAKLTQADRDGSSRLKKRMRLDRAAARALPLGTLYFGCSCTLDLGCEIRPAEWITFLSS